MDVWGFWLCKDCIENKKIVMDLCEIIKILSLMYYNVVLYIVIVFILMLFEVNVVFMVNKFVVR